MVSLASNSDYCVSSRIKLGRDKQRIFLPKEQTHVKNLLESLSNAIIEDHLALY